MLGMLVAVTGLGFTVLFTEKVLTYSEVIHGDGSVGIVVGGCVGMGAQVGCTQVMRLDLA